MTVEESASEFEIDPQALATAFGIELHRLIGRHEAQTRFNEMLAKQRKAKLSEDGMALPEQVPSIIDFMDEVNEEYDWIIPGRMPRGSRMILTAGEGSGKSTMFRWIAICTAIGRDPFTFAEIEPKRVMIIDAENPHNLVKRRFQSAIAEARELGGDMELLKTNLFIESRPEGIEFSDPDDVARLESIVDDRRPDLLAIGPIYRLSGLEEASEAFFDTITGAIDKVRVKFGLTVMLEAHTTHAQRTAQGNETRSKRPIGSSGWMRWTEIGLHLGNATDTGIQRLVNWRPSRFGEDINWPQALVRVLGSQVRWLASNDNGVLSEGDIQVQELQMSQRRSAFGMDPGVRAIVEGLRTASSGWTTQADVASFVERPAGMTLGAHQKGIERLLNSLEEAQFVRSHKGPNAWGLRVDRRYWSATELGIMTCCASAHPTPPTDGLSGSVGWGSEVDVQI